MNAYYNEHDPRAADWLRELIREQHIAPGDVDERSIVDVSADDLRAYTQCHFFAGIGGWSLALRLAGWADERPVWTGSCPCQPFSAAGKGQGKADERHLWPAFFRLIRECRPGVVFGEQVAAAVGFDWLDHVCDDLEHEGYAVGPVVLPACSVGAFHIRSRLWFVADSERWPAERRGHDLAGSAGNAQGETRQWERLRDDARSSGDVGELADPQGSGRQQGSAHAGRRGEAAGTQAQWRGFAEHGAYGVAQGDADESGSQGRRLSGERAGEQSARPASVDFWADAEWIACTDGKARPTFARLQFVADGIQHGLVSQRTESEEVNGAASVSGAGSPLRGVQYAVEALALHRRIARSDAFQQTQVLRSEVHGAGNDRSYQSSEREEQPPAICTSDEGGMRELWRYITASCASSGRESTEQRAIESGDVVRALSHAHALAHLEGDDQTTQALSALRQACAQQRTLQYTQDSLANEWQSACTESKDRFAVDSGTWRMIPVSPLATVPVPGRVGLLRGAGNAIVPQAAAEVIAAYMDIAA